MNDRARDSKLRVTQPWASGLMLNGLVVGLAIVALAPVAWLSRMALVQDGQLTLVHFQSLLATQPVGRWVLNSLVLSAGQVVISVPVCAAAGFVLGRHRFRGRGLVLALLVPMAVLPGQVVLPGLFGQIVAWGWLDTFGAIWLPSAVSVFAVLLYRAAFLRVSGELLEAGRLDGCGEVRLWWSIAMPVVKPTTSALVLLTFLGAWNNLLWPAVVLVSDERFTLPLALSQLTATARSDADLDRLAAAVVLSLLPPAVLFLLCQRDFIPGLSAGTGR